MKPHIKYWKGLWECAGLGLHSFGSSPINSFERWTVFVERMRVHE
jgi:hypothetical protein